MAVNKVVISEAIKVLTASMESKEYTLVDGVPNPAEVALAKQEFADGLADIITAAIVSATVTVSPGISVSTAGTAVAQTGATTSTGTGVLS